MATVREIIDWLTQAAADLPEGLDTDAQIGICDGSGVRLMPRVDVKSWTRVSLDGQEPDEPFVMLRCHEHPGDEVTSLPGFAEDIESDLRKLTDPAAE